MTTSINQLLTAFDIDHYAHQSKEHLVIDAGHTSLGTKDGKYVFGHNKAHPSSSEENTLQLAFELASKLCCFQKKCTVHICFSDTTKNFEKIHHRDSFKQILLENKVFNLLPSSYQDLIRRYSDIDVSFSLQTQLSNLSTKLMKGLKKKLKKLKDNSHIFKEYGAFFMKDMLDDNFGLVHPFILDHAQETLTMGGDWWLDEESSIHPADLTLNPLLKVKKSGTILLYSKISGILCPGTYAGLMFGLNPNIDFLSIYSRDDDPAIGEKINSGVIAALTISKAIQCKCTQFITTSGMKKCEITEINPQKLKSYQSQGFKAFFEQVSERGLLEKYQPYI
ncbi:MAG: hypothetical protein PVI40_01135 [Chlamydiota bacterium]